MNRTLGCDVFILPGLLAAAVDDDWLETQRAIQSEAVSLNSSLPIYATIALSADAAKNNNQVARLMDESEKWPAKGYYLVFEHPNGEYLVDDGNWLANVLDITAGLKLRGAKVVMGYCNHQMLIAACAGVDALCSGTWMNVRSFPPDKFRVSYDDEIKQRATWFYCPQALSEYKIPMLDLAHRQRILDDLKPDRTFDNAYVQPLFAGAQPSSVGFTEQSAFRHYLHCLRLQAQAASQTTFDATVSAHHTLLDAVERRLKALSSAGISGQLRDFRNIIDCNRGALAAFVATRGPMLRHHWSSL